MISMRDHARRAKLAVEALGDLGHQNAITYFDPKDNVIRIELMIPEGIPQLSQSDLVSALQDRVRTDLELQGKAAMVDALDVDLTVTIGSAPIVTADDSRGGN